MNLFEPYRVADTPGPSEDCLIFAWIGQTFESCDECGRPDREHPYTPVYGDDRPDLYIKQYDRLSKNWEWRPIKVKKLNQR